MTIGDREEWARPAIDNRREATTESRMRIAINGAGIAGPTLAYWLSGAGHQVLLVEAAPTLRTGG